MKKKIRGSTIYRDFMTIQMKKIVRPLLKDPFNLESSPFGSLNSGLTGVSFHF
jgi:hypothetical protein